MSHPLSPGEASSSLISNREMLSPTALLDRIADSNYPNKLCLCISLAFLDSCSDSKSINYYIKSP